MNKNIIRFFTICMLAGLVAGLPAQTTRRGTTFQLSVTANVRANVLVQSRDNRSFSPIKGTTNLNVALPAGTYTIEISAPGYPAQSRVVVMDRNRAENFTFQTQRRSAGAQLNITSNVNGARVDISGPRSISGTAPFRMELPQGSYTVSVSAPGYSSQTQTVNLQRNENLHFNLQQPLATIQVIIPNESLNRTINNAMSQISIYDNGILMNSTVFTIQPGQHTIQVRSGGFATQSTIIAEAGRTYTIRPILSLIIE
ncbi:PEGA domain-containing protein [Spirochaeta isovalerica]|uniref:PEGA domain-containing protein n=1 Tax=Spirochaeta isovalerica TaxID=150 RepID=A0A841RD98_9SPIO|nr:PEGA domain-containing protein [Spirochaeta isovalerica]MBB6480362.1 hypothetical protein [Spirochaeta isovalerica]